MAGGSHGPSPGQENASCAQRLSKSTASFGSNPDSHHAALSPLPKPPAASQRLPPATGQHPGIAHVKRHQPAASGDVPQRQLGLQRYETAWMMASRIATSYGQPRTRSAMGRSGSRRDLG